MYASFTVHQSKDQDIHKLPPQTHKVPIHETFSEHDSMHRRLGVRPTAGNRSWGFPDPGLLSSNHDTLRVPLGARIRRGQEIMEVCVVELVERGVENVDDRRPMYP